MRDGVVMNKKIKIGLFALIIIGVITLCLTYKSKNNITKTKKKKQSNIAIIIKEENGIETTSKEIPKGLYELNYEKSYCKNNGKILDYDNILGKVSFSFIGTSNCYLYFEYAPYGYLQILNNNGGKSAIKARGEFYIDSGRWGESGMYSSNDDLGTTYFFNGRSYSSISNNLIKFGQELQAICKYNGQQVKIGFFNSGSEQLNGTTIIKDEKECNSAVGICNSSESGYVIGVTKNECSDIGTWIDATPVYGGLEMIDMYWKITRINGDNSIRMIYSNSIGIGLSKYHEFDNQSEYVGYMYEIGKQHGYKDDSTIKLYVDNWYKTTSLIGADSKYVADTIFCNDRDASLSKSNFSTLTNWSSTGVNYYYRAISKFYGDPYKNFNGDLKPNFLCLNDDDRFTVSNIKGKGNGALTYPVGLMTADEVYFYPLGGYIGVYTMTPTDFINGSRIAAFFTGSEVHKYPVTSTGKVIPVISLSSKVKLTGDGSSSNPYIISEN